MNFSQREMEILTDRVIGLYRYSGEKLTPSNYIKWLITRNSSLDSDITAYVRDGGFLLYMTPGTEVVQDRGAAGRPSRKCK